MICLISLSTEQHITGGYRYNEKIVSELNRHCEIFYKIVSRETTRAPRIVGEIPDHCSHVIFDSIFFAFSDLGRELLSLLPGKKTILLTHWLPWIEEPLIDAELKKAGLSDIPFSKIREDQEAFLGLFDAYIANSRFTADELLRRGIHRKQMIIAPPGIDETVLEIRKKRRYRAKGGAPGLHFLSAAHWTPVKGVHRLLPALHTLYGKQAVPAAEPVPSTGAAAGSSAARRWTWHSVGGLYRETAYGRYLFQSLTSGKFNFPYELHGTLEPEECWKLLASCDCMLVPSVFETYGMAASESVALGVPVIGFDTGGISEAVRNGTDGFLCATEEEYIRVLEQLTENPGLLAELNQTCYKKPVQKWKETAKLIYDFLARL